MPASIGVNLRVTGHCRQGGRKYMEDFFSVAYQQTEDEKDLEYAFFGIYDGHGGGEAATFAKEHLMEAIVRHKNFWSERDEDVLKAIKDGYIATHYAMWKEQEKWPRTASGLPSTAGTTASVAFIRRGRIYLGHVGDSAIILGYQEAGQAGWKARALTSDHKPESARELSRIAECGGKVVSKAGVPRVVWNRPRLGHRGPVRRSTPIDEIPFLAVARSLGDLWSYNSALDRFVVSPAPDTACIPIDACSFRCLIFGTDGLWNMTSPAAAVSIVQMAEQHNERSVLLERQSHADTANKAWINPSKCLVERALECWSSTRMRADNTSVITLMLDPPGPPRSQVIQNQRLSLNNNDRCINNISSEQQQQQSSWNHEEGNDATMLPNDNYRQQQQKQYQQQQQQQQEPMPKTYPKTGLEIRTLYVDEQSPSSSSTAIPSAIATLDEKEVRNNDGDDSGKHPETTIQSNEVSSSSEKRPKAPKTSSQACVRCTRSQDGCKPKSSERVLMMVLRRRKLRSPRLRLASTLCCTTRTTIHTTNAIKRLQNRH